MVDDAPDTIRLRHGALMFYYVSFALITLLTVIGLATGNISESLVGIPMIAILGFTIIHEKMSLHVPPEIVVFVVAAFFLAFVSRNAAGDGNIFSFVADVLTGINLGLMGLMLIYVLMKTMPGMRGENRLVVSFIVSCIAIASYTLIIIANYLVIAGTGHGTAIDMDGFMYELAGILLGDIIVCVSYGLGRRNIFGGIINSFLEENSGIIGMDDMDRSEILRLIDEGESENLEFKSTLRTNLQTGETDKRMEKAAMKTIVAFLNSSGGNLMIGVSDDGDVIGCDVSSFDNKDKMNLHLSNLISSQIGSSFLPYIKFITVDFDDRTVIRVRCDPCEKPVFLKEGKAEQFYIRKGPQSEELTGMNLINYVNNRKKRMSGNKRFSRS